MDLNDFFIYDISHYSRYSDEEEILIYIKNKLDNSTFLLFKHIFNRQKKEYILEGFNETNEAKVEYKGRYLTNDEIYTLKNHIKEIYINKYFKPLNLFGYKYNSLNKFKSADFNNLFLRENNYEKDVRTFEIIDDIDTFVLNYDILNKRIINSYITKSDVSEPYITFLLNPYYDDKVISYIFEKIKKSNKYRLQFLLNENIS